MAMEKKRKPGLTALAACCALALTGTATAAGSLPLATGQTVSAFDKAVSAGLPQRLSLPMAASSRGGASQLVVERQVPVEVTLPDGTKAVTYAAQFNGEPVVVVRSGNRIDMASHGEKGVEVTGFTAQDDKVRVTRIGDTVGEAGSPGSPLPELPGATAAAAADEPLQFWVFLHDDLAQDTETINAGYFAWWVLNMKSEVVPHAQIKLNYVRRLADYTDMAYGKTGSLQTWDEKVATYARAHRIDLSNRTKFMLFTAHQPEPGRTGVARHRGFTAIASDDNYINPAHEFGHTMDGRHEYAEVRFINNWWCETNMHNAYHPLRSSCYFYTARNDRHIR
jgi:hypothetical protein